MPGGPDSTVEKGAGRSDERVSVWALIGSKRSDGFLGGLDGVASVHGMLVRQVDPRADGVPCTWRRSMEGKGPPMSASEHTKGGNGVDRSPGAARSAFDDVDDGDGIKDHG